MAMLPWWIHYPNVNNEIINLDWILQISNENTETIENFIGVNTIKYADPILWDITSQYEANTIVVDPQTGDAYISTKAVPYGVALSNESYWTRIYNYASEIHIFREQIAVDEQLSTTASAARAVDDLVFLNGLLYRVTAPMIAGDSYVVGSNCVKTTINAELLRLHTSIGAEAQAREDADTALGGRIDEEAEARAEADTALGGRIDDEAEARADADTALGGRIDDEADARAEADTALGQRIDDEAEARAEADTALGGRITDIAELIGDLSELKTTDKNSIVGSINNIIDNTYVNVKWFGAVGDGETNDYNAFRNAINNCPIHGTVLIPIGNYKIDTTLIINKPIRLLGDYTGWDIEENTSYVTNDEFKKPLLNISGPYAIQINVLGVTLENISITCDNTGVLVNNSTAQVAKFDRFNQFKNVTLHKSGEAANYGFLVEFCGLTLFERCLVNGFAVGYQVSGNNDGVNSTSLVFNNCWAQNYSQVGYRIYDCYYSSFISCAADTLSPTANGYYLIRCWGVTLLSCGAENNANGYVLEDCHNCTLSGLVVCVSTSNYGMQILGTSEVFINGFRIVKTNVSSSFRDVLILNTSSKVILVNTNLTRVVRGASDNTLANGFFASTNTLETIS